MSSRNGGITQTRVLKVRIPFTSKALVIWTDEPQSDLEWNVGPMFGYEQILRDVTKTAITELSVQYVNEMLKSEL
jgi:hypothetical protein